MKKLLLFTTLIVFIASCTEDIEGCLDAEATNFDPSADVTCCCEYPQFIIKMTYQNYDTDTTTFALNTVYNDNDGTPYSVNNVQLYLSDFELIKSDNSITQVIDSIDVTLQNGTATTLTNDFSILKTNVFQYNIGTTNISGDFTKIRFKVGLNNIANQVNPESVITTHELSDANGLYENNAYIFNQINIISDTSTTDIITNYNVNSAAITIELNHNFSIYSGFDTEVKVNADIKKLLETVDFQNDSYDTIVNTILANTSNIFTIVQ